MVKGKIILKRLRNILKDEPKPKDPVLHFKATDTIKKLQNIKDGLDLSVRSQEYHIGYMDGVGAAMDYIIEENDQA